MMQFSWPRRCFFLLRFNIFSLFSRCHSFPLTYIIFVTCRRFLAGRNNSKTRASWSRTITVFCIFILLRFVSLYGNFFQLNAITVIWTTRSRGSFLIPPRASISLTRPKWKIPSISFILSHCVFMFMKQVNSAQLLQWETAFYSHRWTTCSCSCSISLFVHYQW